MTSIAPGEGIGREPLRNRYNASTVGSVIGAVAAATIGGVAGGMIGGIATMSYGALLGAVLGGFTGGVAGHAATNGAERRYDGDPHDLLGYVVLDRDGHRIGKVASVYLATDGRPWYLGVATTWLTPGTVHLMPASGLAAGEQGRRFVMPLTGDALRFAPTLPIRLPIDSRTEDAIWQHYEPRGLTPMPLAHDAIHPALAILPEEAVALRTAVQPPADSPDFDHLIFSGDAPYRVAGAEPLQPIVTLGPNGPSAGSRPNPRQDSRALPKG